MLWLSSCYITQRMLYHVMVHLHARIVYNINTHNISTPLLHQDEPHPLGTGAFNPLDSLKYFSIQASIFSKIFRRGFPTSPTSKTPSLHQTLQDPIIPAISTSVPNRSPTTAISPGSLITPRSLNHRTTSSPQKGFFSACGGSRKTGIWRRESWDSSAVTSWEYLGWLPARLETIRIE